MDVPSRPTYSQKPSTARKMIALYVCFLVFTVIVSAVFIGTWMTNQRTSAQWNRLNSLVLTGLLLSMICTTCQFFMTGRSELGCRILHHVSGSSYSIGYGLGRVFFAWRFLMMSTGRRQSLLGRFLIGASIAITTVHVLFLNMTLSDVCDTRKRLCH